MFYFYIFMIIISEFYGNNKGKHYWPTSIFIKSGGKNRRHFAHVASPTDLRWRSCDPAGFQSWGGLRWLVVFRRMSWECIQSDNNNNKTIYWTAMMLLCASTCTPMQLFQTLQKTTPGTSGCWLVTDRWARPKALVGQTFSKEVLWRWLQSMEDILKWHQTANW